MDMKGLIKKTEYAGKIKCILQVFEQFEINSIEKIENSPGIIGSGQICDESVHAIASVLAAAYRQSLIEASSARAEAEETTEVEVQTYRPAKKGRSESKAE